MNALPISVIIPFSRPQVWSALLQQLHALRYPRTALEIIIVINTIDQWRPAQLPPDIRVIWEAKRGPSYARNAGIRAARFQNQVFLDDDCVFNPEILNLYAAAWRKYPSATILGGKILAQIQGQKTFTHHQQQLLQRFSWCFGQADYGDLVLPVDVSTPLFSANFAIAQPLKNPHVFPEQLGKFVLGRIFFGGEDCLLVYSLLCAGKKAVYLPQIQVHNSVSSQRFSQHYVWRRTVLAGAERLVTDLILKQQQQWTTYYQTLIGAIKQSLRGNFSILNEVRNQPYSGWFLLGYMTLGPLLWLNNSLEKPRPDFD